MRSMILMYRPMCRRTNVTQTMPRSGMVPPRRGVAKQQEGAIPMERGENEYEPICYRRSDTDTAGKEQDDTASAGGKAGSKR